MSFVPSASRVYCCRNCCGNTRPGHVCMRTERPAENIQEAHFMHLQEASMQVNMAQDLLAKTTIPYATQ